MRISDWSSDVCSSDLIWRRVGQADDVAGAMTVGVGRIGIDDVTGSLPLGRAFAPLPIGSLDMEDVSIRFSGDHCGHAEGRVRAHVAGQVAGLNLLQGLRGFATCDGVTVLLPLVSQSGMGQMTVRLWLSGRYTAEMRVEMADPALETARSEEHTYELQSLMRISYAVFC